MTDISIASLVEQLRHFSSKALAEQAADALVTLQAENEQLHMELIKAGELIDADLLARAVKADAEIEKMENTRAELIAEIERIRLTEIEQLKDRAERAEAEVDEWKRYADALEGDLREAEP